MGTHCLLRRRLSLLLGLFGACSSEPAPARLRLEPAPVFKETAEPQLPPKRLFVRKFVARVRDQPSSSSPQLGYLRAGTVLTATTGKPLGYDRCRRGWYRIAEPPGGYVCDGREVTAFEGKVLPDRQPTLADRSASLPYRYAFNRVQGSPMYKRLPTEDEALFWEDGVIPADSGAPEGALAAMGLAVDGSVPMRPRTLEELQGERGGLVRRRLNRGFHVSLDREFDTGKRRYWRTLSNGYIPLERMMLLPGSTFGGLRQPALPLAFVVTKYVPKQRLLDKSRLVSAGVLPYHTVFPLREVREVAGKAFAITPEGELVRLDQLTRVEIQPRPREVAAAERWIDVDLATQSLVAYDGDIPVYATLVSTGRVRNGRNPLLSHETPVGLFRLLSKHVSTTMDGNHAVFGAYSLEDVPYVQFFRGAYALHGAFWHDRFGRPASHGCINLAPKDAHWLFGWTLPTVPAAWHAAYPRVQEKGTWLRIRGKTPPG